MSKFNFNEILLSAKANISKIMENFTKVEDNALASSDIIDNLTTNDATKVLSAKQGKILNDMKINSSNFYVYTSPKVTGSSRPSIDEQLPNGWTNANCIIISVELGTGGSATSAEDENIQWHAASLTDDYSSSDYSYAWIQGDRVGFYTTKTGASGANFSKIVLMKIS